MSQAPGWYRDPFFRDQERYWDGKVWTQGVQPAGTPAAMDAAPVASAEASGPAPAVPPLDPVVSGAPPAELTPIAPPIYAPLGAPVAPVVAAVPPTAWVAPPGGRNGQRRRAAFAVAAAALLLVGGGVAGALVLGGSGGASASAAVAQAATQTSAQSVDMSMSIDMSAAGMHETMTANGAFDFAHQAGTMTMTIPAGSSPITEQVIYDGSTIYMSGGGLPGSMTQGKQWVSADISQLEAGSGSMSGLNTIDNPSALLQQLESIGGTVTSLGPTTYDGSAVTKYSVHISASALERDIGQLPFSMSSTPGLAVPDVTASVYVTSDNLLRAIDLPVTFTVLGKTATIDMTMAFSNYGTTVNVVPPPADEVTPLGDLGNGGLGFGNSGATGGTGSTGSTGNTGNTAAI